MATIRLEGLSLFGHHGIDEAEREAGTRLDVDVELELDTRKAEETDRLRHTVNYDEIFAVVRDRVENDSFHLLESLAGDIAHVILTTFGASRVLVRLSKLNLGWPSGGHASIEVERFKGRSKAPLRQGSPAKKPRKRTAATRPPRDSKPKSARRR